MKFSRRVMVVGGLAAVVSCSKKPEAEVCETLPPAVPLDATKRKLQAAIIAAQPDTLSVQFVEILVGLLVEFLVQLVSQCLLQHILQQHRAINRHPEGSVARRWRDSIALQFSAAHPEQGTDAAVHYATGAREAFRKATVEEVTEAVQSIHAGIGQLSDVDWNRASQTAREITLNVDE